MDKPMSPFSSRELLPQEETLEIIKPKRELFIGIPKETSYQENRVCLTPDAVSDIVNNGHRVLIESGAGENANYSDKDFSEAGAQITNDVQKVYSCPMILKVEPPTIEELEYINPHTIIFSALQLKTQCKSYFEKLAKKRITALAFEFVREDSGAYPVVRSLSEIAGTASVLIAAELLSNANNGNGLMLGNICGVPPAQVVIVGAGNVAEFAAKSALGLGANVKVFDNSVTRLRRIQTNLGQSFYTSTIQPKTLMKALRRCDVVIGAIRGTNRAPVVVTENMVENMKKGAVIIDVSIDMGGCIETSEITSHINPTFVKHDVIHYCVPNIPARYARTASISLSNILTPYLLKIAEEGGIEQAIHFDKGLKQGVYYYRGILTNRPIAEWFDLKYNDINLFMI